MSCGRRVGGCLIRSEELLALLPISHSPFSGVVVVMGPREEVSRSAERSGLLS